MASSIRPRLAIAAAKVVVGVCVVGLEFQGRPEMRDGLVDLAVAGQSDAEAEVGAWMTRPLRDAILPEENIITIIVVSLPGEDGQRETNTAQQATENRCPPPRGKG